ncbi:TadE/TadG family type IV pilus assembly protein [Marivivens sp. JLT3646]|uniref:TadE/TadG family type IV pilus assembly protein n=1 Tax=Marivivens sp. JLT3646 TaxID=1920883 RepID=UPI00080045AB|nr:TadE/TadG family type IV pilus assembly protein [Marivivens sp. JLT3646]APO87203.1 hypothetical protein BSK21_09205 [Marivivens sp. JLT3646]OBR39925.1 hypothetical protein A9199_02890 [Donghicola sp. JL3646]
MAQKIGRLRKFWADCSGAAALEFALVAPPLILMVVGMVDIGWLQFQKTMLQQITREGASAAMAGLDPETAMSSVIAIKRLSGTPTVSMTCLNDLGSVVAPCTASGAIDKSVVTVSLSITMNHSPLIAYAENFGVGGEISDNLKVQLR